MLTVTASPPDGSAILNVSDKSFVMPTQDEDRKSVIDSLKFVLNVLEEVDGSAPTGGGAGSTDSLTAAIQTLTDKVNAMAGEIDAKITDLQADVSSTRDVVNSAATLLDGLSAQLKDALDAAKNAGATPEQLQALSDVHTGITSQRDALASAVARNTPAAPSGSDTTGGGGSTPAPQPEPTPAPSPEPAPAPPPAPGS